jgi:hypothetical protein
MLNIGIGLLVLILCACAIGFLSLLVFAVTGAFGPVIALCTLAVIGLVFCYYLGRFIRFDF